MFSRARRFPRIDLLRYAIYLLSLCLCLSIGIQNAHAAVQITSFTAAWVNDDVVVSWETASELNNAGFYVQRSDTENGIFQRITELIPAEGDPFSGSDYDYVDSNATSGNTYWYKLETIDLNQESEYYGPISSAPPTPTPTATNPATTTNTPSPTLTGSPAATLTPTLTLTQPQAGSTATLRPPTAYPAPATATRSAAQPTAGPLLPTQPPLSTPGDITATEVVSSSAIFLQQQPSFPFRILP